MRKLERHTGTAPAALLVPGLRETGGWDRMVTDLRAGLDPFPASDPFDEPMSGLQTRELHGDDLFVSLFGAIPV